MKHHQYRMGLVGNCSYLAYIDEAAAVKWLCWPKFDSSFVFGSLLDTKVGGEFSITPVGEFKSKQSYIANTNVLCTEFETSTGKFRVIDCAPRFFQYERIFRPLMFVRKIELLSGSPVIKVICDPSADYGKRKPEKVPASNHIRFLDYSMQMRLTTDISLSHIMDAQPFVLIQNQYLVLTYGEALEAPLKATAEDFINKTVRHWQTWIKSTYVPDIYQDLVIRSALVLKLHQYEDTGGIIASGTTSLPEHHMSSRTWDYRYCWFRDSYYTLKAFNELGHFDELEKYFEYIQNVLMRDTGRMQPLYTITGQKDIEEIHLDLEGYLGNQPVRVGNKAYLQIQNDVYGQVLVGLLPLFIDRRLSFPGRSSYKLLADRLLFWIDKTMDEPDAGLWEFRNVKQVHTYTLLFHWAGAKAVAKLGRNMGDSDIVARAEAIAQTASEKIERCYDPVRKVYTQAYGAEYLDASTLKLITMGYLDPNSEKARLHLKALEELLKTDQGLFYRYVHQDDFGKPEATFLVCAFWYVDALACVGRIDDATKTLDGILSFANHLNIFSEDVGLDGSQWGNYPQTYSHVGLINAVFRISKKLDAPGFK
ncbi:MAG TPA: glycoside hydrolase family 15 protein [Cyclobacteriaceae bacterium]|nr:glycoside hydrolase family 15 protein [Cyclobacteriaceae bacterium]